ncbi:MAG: GNAT family N-acetyltransferase, partial [Athalassotoga sp.]
MKMAIRFIKSDEYERAQQIVTYCFPWLHEVSDNLTSYKLQYIKPENVLGFYDDESDQLMALAEDIPFKIMINGSPMDMGGIAMVASLPEGRHAGHVALILKRWL